MADGGDSGEGDAARLEAALARIARAAAHATTPPPRHPDLKFRLDTLIAELRAVLGRDSPE